MFSVWHQMMLYDELDVPEARFGYNLSPMAVLVKSEKRPWYDFITKVLAIVGGTFSVVRQRLVPYMIPSLSHTVSSHSFFYPSCEPLLQLVSWGPKWAVRLEFGSSILPEMALDGFGVGLRRLYAADCVVAPAEMYFLDSYTSMHVSGLD